MKISLTEVNNNLFDLPQFTNCPICCNELKIGVATIPENKIARMHIKCKHCGYSYKYSYHQFQEQIGSHLLTWYDDKFHDDIGPTGEKSKLNSTEINELKTNFRMIRLQAISEAREDWLKKKENLSESSGIHVNWDLKF